jgi:hypothetical protein
VGQKKQTLCINEQESFLGYISVRTESKQWIDSTDMTATINYLTLHNVTPAADTIPLAKQGMNQEWNMLDLSFSW